MNDNTIITINRECGTGGGEIARLLGEKLGYDPGPEYVKKWILENGESFRQNWPTYSAEWHEKKQSMNR
jgi:hypothetical protein